MTHSKIFRALIYALVLGVSLVALQTTGPLAQTRPVPSAREKADVLVEQSISPFKQRRYLEALALCRQAVATDPAYSRAYVGLGTCYERLGRRKLACQAFQKALQLHPNTSDLKKARAGLGRLGCAEELRPVAPPSGSPSVVQLPRLPASGPWNSWPSSPQVLIVSASPRSQPGSFQRIEAAIRVAQPYARILVRPGYYKESLVLNKPVQIIGDGKRKDIVIESTDKPCIVMQTHSAVVRGLTVRSRVSRTNAFHAVNISQGRLLMEDCEIRSASRACVSIYGSATNPLLRNCVIRGALTSGIIVFAGGKGTIEDCDIFDNADAGVEVTQGATPVLRRCKIRNSQGRGLVISGKGRSTLTECEISDNAFAGIEVRRDGSASIRQCRINRNLAAVWMWPGSAAAVERCDLTDNKQGPWKIERAVSLYRSGNRI